MSRPDAPMPRPQNTVPSANTRAALQSGGRGEGQAAVGSSIKAMSLRRDPKIRLALCLSTHPRWNFSIFQRLRNIRCEFAAAK